jgi:hypothetical protein
MSIKKFSDFLNEASSQKIKIKYTEITKKSYETSTDSIKFLLEINGISCKGAWSPLIGTVSSGVDINELQIEDRLWGKTIDIFDGGGTHRSYEIRANLEFAEKQPKDLRFTGRTMTVSNLKKVFVDKIQNALQNPEKEPKLTEEFIKFFKLEKYIADQRGKIAGKNTGVL